MLLPRKSVSAIVAACVLALAGCGSNDSSAPAQTQPPPPGNAADRAFVNGILPLHEKAVAIAIIGQRKGSNYVKDLSRRIAGTQPEETARLRAIGAALFAASVPVGSLGVAPTDAADVDLKALRASASFDRAFLRAMIPIHQATIALCTAEIAKGQQVDLKTTAQSMIDSEGGQLASMRKRLKT